VRFGDWRRVHPALRVIQRLEAGDDEVFLVRAGDASAPATTYYVDGRTGRLGREDGMTFIPNLGRVGRRMTFRDFREVAGVLLPWRTEIELANPMIGAIVTTVEEVEAGAALPPGGFELRGDDE
jgi:hypothetical protein